MDAGVLSALVSDARCRTGWDVQLQFLIEKRLIARLPGSRFTLNEIVGFTVR